MGNARRKFTVEEKQDILRQARQTGATAVLRKYNLSYNILHRWKQSFEEDSKTPEHKAEAGQTNSRFKELSEENALLKKIIANQAMLLELKEEELRKRRTV